MTCQKKQLDRPQKSRVGRVSGNETFFFWPRISDTWIVGHLLFSGPMNLLHQVEQKPARCVHVRDIFIGITEDSKHTEVSQIGLFIVVSKEAVLA